MRELSKTFTLHKRAINPRIPIICQHSLINICLSSGDNCVYSLRRRNIYKNSRVFFRFSKLSFPPSTIKNVCLKFKEIKFRDHTNLCFHATANYHHHTQSILKFTSLNYPNLFTLPNSSANHIFLSAKFPLASSTACSQLGVLLKMHKPFSRLTLI